MAIGSTKIQDNAKFVFAWINHSNEHCCAALRAAIILDRRIFSECGKRLLSCIVDFIVQPAWLNNSMCSRPVPTIDHELVAAPSGSMSGVAG